MLAIWVLIDGCILEHVPLRSMRRRVGKGAKPARNSIRTNGAAPCPRGGGSKGARLTRGHGAAPVVVRELMLWSRAFAHPTLPSHSRFRSRGALRPGCPFSFRLPEIEGKRSAETARRVLRHPAACHDAARRGTWRGAPRVVATTRAPSRRSTVAIYDGSGSALPSPAFPPESVQRRSSRPVLSDRRADSRASRACGYEPQPRDATPASASGSSLETPLDEPG